MQLIIAEKPSVARDLARVLGVRGAGKHAIEGSGRVITWCIGHLVELEEPAAYDAAWKAWRLDTLPMLPAALQAATGAGHARSAAGGAGAAARSALHRGRERLRRRARGRADLSLRLRAGGQPPADQAPVDLVADRRGDPGGLRRRCGRAASSTRSPSAARCRSEADWLVGMNATRAVTVSSRAAAPRPRAAPAPAARGQRGTAIRRCTRSAACRRRRWRSSCGASWRSGSSGRATTGRCAARSCPRGRPPTAAEKVTATWGVALPDGKAIRSRLGERALADGVVARGESAAGGRRTVPWSSGCGKSACASRRRCCSI